MWEAEASYSNCCLAESAPITSLVAASEVRGVRAEGEESGGRLVADSEVPGGP